MKRKRHTPEQIIRLLEKIDIRSANGVTKADACREFGVHETTYHRWVKKYGGMDAQEARRLKDLEKENARLKQIVADLTLDNAALKDLAEGNF